MSLPDTAGATGHRYPRRAFWVALARAGLGFALAAVLLFAAAGEPLVVALALGIVALFAAYGFRALVRARQAVVLSPDGVAIVGAFARAIRWNELTGVRLAYYTTRRDGENGWMELSLRSGRTRIALESELDGFADIAMASGRAAARRGLPLSAASQRNFAALEAGAPARERPLLRRVAGER